MFPILHSTSLTERLLVFLQETQGLQLQAAQAALTSATLGITQINQALAIAVEQHASAVVG